MSWNRLRPAGTLWRVPLTLATLALPPVTASGAAAQAPVPRPPAATAPSRSKPVTPEELGVMAQGEGLRGTMHGANERLGAYVFTWWYPGSFFQSVNMSLFPGSTAVAAELAALERHQEVLVRGRLVRVPGSQPHLVVERVEPGKKWNPGVETVAPSDRRVDLRKALAGKKRLRALVHALSPDGGMLVVEYRGEVIPVQVPQEPALRKRVSELFRGDRISFRYQIAEHPRSPLHLLLSEDPESERETVEVRDAIHDLHDQPRTIEGRLVVFPRSPALRRTIYGVEERGPDGLHRYFTVFNFSDLKDQEKIDTLLQDVLKAEPEGVMDGRNKYIHTRVRLRVTGKVSNPAANQANPTLVTTSENVEVLR